MNVATSLEPKVDSGEGKAATSLEHKEESGEGADKNPDESADKLVKLEQVKELERLAEELNSEFSKLSPDMPINYDW